MAIDEYPAIRASVQAITTCSTQARQERMTERIQDKWANATQPQSPPVLLLDRRGLDVATDRTRGPHPTL
jgi:hypothetical protein